MSHDVKKNKLLKKIIGFLGYKIVDKKSAKTERLIESLSFSSGDFIKFLINTKKINEIIQIGANDGKSDDFLRESINKDTKVLLVEPIESAFIELKKNYSGYNNVKFINKALYNKKSGYYMKSNPFGKEGDFITGPNISILFSEMIAIWCVSFWENLGCPKKINIIELGAGNGEMMFQMIKAFNNFNKFLCFLREQFFIFYTSSICTPSIYC